MTENDGKKGPGSCAPVGRPLIDFLELNFGDNVACKDPIVETVVQRFRERSNVGVQKYGTTLEENKGDIFYWLQHIQEELMDAVNYIEKTRSVLKGLNLETEGLLAPTPTKDNWDAALREMTGTLISPRVANILRELAFKGVPAK